MIIEEIKNIKSGKKELRQFGIVISIALVILGAFCLWRGREAYVYFFILSAGFLLSGLLRPFILKPFQKIWMSFAVILGWVTSRIILTILFYVIITPIGFFARCIRKEFLALNFAKKADTYWISKKYDKFDSKFDINRYEKQF